MSGKLITVAETQLFPRQAQGLWSEDEPFDFVNFIAGHPETGDIISETGGVRKIRWGRQGHGKRGGVRVIYMDHGETVPLYLLMIYSKSRKEDIGPAQTRSVIELTEILKKRSGRERA